MKTIRHIQLYNMPDLKQATRLFAVLCNKPCALPASIERDEKSHLDYLDKLDSLGAFASPEDKLIYTHLRILSNLKYTQHSDDLQFAMRRFTQNVATSKEGVMTLRKQYEKEILSPEIKNYIKYVTIPEFLALYPEGKIKAVACNVTKSIYENYFDLTSADIKEADYMIMATEKEPIRPANKSVDEFIEDHAPIFAKIKGAVRNYELFDDLHNTLLNEQLQHMHKAREEKIELSVKCKNEYELKEGFEAYLSKDVGQHPGHANVEQILRQNLEATKERIQSYEASLRDADAQQTRYSDLYDAFTDDPHGYLVDKMPTDLKV